MRGWLVFACVIACGGRHGERVELRGERPLAFEPPPAADARERVAAGSRKWLSGALDGAVAELERAGGDPHARGLLARAYLMLDHEDDARRTTTRAIGTARAAPRILTDISKIDGIEVSPDGAFVATIESDARYRNPATVTVWNTLAGRDVFSAAGDQVAFGTSAGAMYVVTLARDAGTMQAFDAATGAERWTRKIGNRTWDIAIDRHGVVTTVGAGHAIAQWELATGAHRRDIENTANAAVITVSADGKTLLAANTLIDLGESPKKLGELPGATYGSGIMDRRLSPDGELVATSNRDGSIQLEGRDRRPRLRLERGGAQVTFLDDGTLIGTDGTHVARYNTAGKQLVAFELPSGTEQLTFRLVIGTGGHIVARRDGELVVLLATEARPAVIATFGLVTRTTALAWSPDGNRLAVAGGRGDIAVWSVAGAIKPVTGPHPPAETLGFDAKGDVEINPKAAPSRLTVFEKRAYLRDDKHVLRYFEAPTELVHAVVQGRHVVADDADGVVHVWNADTGEGLGAIEPPDRTRKQVGALALRSDGRTLAIARTRGGIELWDLLARTQVLALAIWPAGWVATTPDGRTDGQLRGLAWIHRTGWFPGVTGAGIEPGLVGRVLAKPAAAVAIRSTPAAALGARDCIAADADVDPARAKIDNGVLSYCLRHNREDPYCYEVDLAKRTQKPVVPSLDYVAEEPSGYDGSSWTPIERAANGVRICTGPDACKLVPVSGSLEDAPLAVSGDATMFAVGDRHSDFVETYDANTAKRIARFRVRYGAGNAHETGGRSLEFWSHNVLAVNTPCAGPCGEATIYSAQGKLLGVFPFEPSMYWGAKMYGDVWLLTGDGGIVVIDEKTGKVYGRRSLEYGFDAAVSPDRIALIHAATPPARSPCSIATPSSSPRSPHHRAAIDRIVVPLPGRVRNPDKRVGPRHLL